MKLLGILVSLSFGCVSLHCMDRMDRMDQATSPIGTPPGSAQASPFGSPASKELATINDLQKNTPKRKALAATLAGLGFAPAEKRSPRSAERNGSHTTIGAGPNLPLQQAQKDARKRVNDGDDSDDDDYENQEPANKRRRTGQPKDCQLPFMNQPATPFADRLRQAAAQQPAIDVDALEDEAAAAQLPPTKESLKNRKRKRDGNGDVDENPSQRRRRFSKESPVDEATMDTDDEDL